MRSGHISTDRVRSEDALGAAISRNIDNSCLDGVPRRSQRYPYVIKPSLTRGRDQSIQGASDLALAVTLDTTEAHDLACSYGERNFMKFTRAREISNFQPVWAGFAALWWKRQRQLASHHFANQEIFRDSLVKNRGNDLTVLHDGYSIGEFEDLRQAVRNKNDSGAALLQAS